jgi:hypothetical protein
MVDMKRLLIFLLLCCLTPCLAQRNQQQAKVDIQVLNLSVSPSASLTDDLVHFKLRLTNKGQKPISYTNNRFVLKDSNGQTHLVSRPWYPQGSLLEPGQSVELDRVYFEIPKKSKPAELALMWRRWALGSVKL